MGNPNPQRLLNTKSIHQNKYILITLPNYLKIQYWYRKKWLQDYSDKHAWPKWYISFAKPTPTSNLVRFTIHSARVGCTCRCEKGTEIRTGKGGTSEDQTAANCLLRDGRRRWRHFCNILTKQLAWTCKASQCVFTGITAVNLLTHWHRKHRKDIETHFDSRVGCWVTFGQLSSQIQGKKKNHVNTVLSVLNLSMAFQVMGSCKEL